MGSTYYIIDAFINATCKSFVRVNKAFVVCTHIGLFFKKKLCSISSVVSFEFGSLDFFIIEYYSTTVNVNGIRILFVLSSIFIKLVDVNF